MNRFSPSALLILVSVIMLVLGVFGVHLGSVSGIKWLEAGLAFFAASFLV